MIPNLRTNQRNLLFHIAQHYLKNPKQIYRLPRYPNHHKTGYIEAVYMLERMNLIHVDRPNDNYLSWKVKILISPESLFNYHQSATKFKSKQ